VKVEKKQKSMQVHNLSSLVPSRKVSHSTNQIPNPLPQQSLQLVQEQFLEYESAQRKTRNNVNKEAN